MAFAAHLCQPLIRKPGDVGGVGHQHVGPCAIFVEGQRCVRGIGTQQARADVPQQLALGIRRQPAGLGDADGNVARSQQVGNAPVVHMLHHKHHLWRFLAQGAQQGWQQAELHVIGQADAESHGADGRVEIMGQAQGRRQGIQGRRQVLDDLLGARRRLHAMAHTNKQRVVEQGTQAVEGRADGRLAEKQLLRHPRHIALEHQCFEDHHQVDIGLA